ncbi:MAG: hypothetical protein IH959_06675 [Chloroflexi bacterium]|nr:hypothetical protein [Chloroflexota bacterium]
MPQTSTVKEFVTALQTRESKTTKALTMYFTKSGRHSGRLPELRRRGALNALPRWARNDLKKLGLENRHLIHINQWPGTQKEKLREALVLAIESNRSIHFFWELHGGRREETEINVPKTGTISVVFRSPQGNVRVSTAPATFGHIMTDVG